MSIPEPPDRQPLYGDGEVPFERPKTNRGLGLPRWFALLDYFFLLRPMILIPVWLFLLLGHYHGLQSAGVYRWTEQLLPDLDLLIGFVAYTLLVGGIYVNNQLNDAETDRRNRKLFLVCDGYISRRAAWTYQIILQALALASALYFADWDYLWIVAASIALGFAYNTPPVKLKGKPLLDIAANAFGNGFFNVAIGYVIVHEFQPDFWLTALPYMLAVGAVFALTTVVDIAGDRESGERTTAVTCGPALTRWLALTLQAGSVTAALLRLNRPALVAGVVCLPLFVVALWGKRKHVKLAYQGTTLLYAVAAGVLHPWFLLFLGLVICLTRYYYRKKFRLKYP
ncbi:MAG: hypothetical protein GF399_00050 [Candidatus Coatesbacteria bacterium]|nr:hypothetical protein [Candidatus Coatesbacteria bacterium]